MNNKITKLNVLPVHTYNSTISACIDLTPKQTLYFPITDIQFIPYICTKHFVV